MTPLMLRQPSLRSTPSTAMGPQVPHKLINVWSLRRYAMGKGTSPRAKVLLSSSVRSPKRQVPASSNGQGIDFSA